MNAKTSVLVIFATLLATLASAGDITGTIVDNTGKPLPGTVLYDIGNCRGFSVLNNEPAKTAHVTRCITDRKGQFTLSLPGDSGHLLARDMEDRFGLFTVNPYNTTYTIHPAGVIQGRLLSGPDPLVHVEVTATLLQSDYKTLRYTMKTRTNRKGQFRFRNMMPGTYLLQTIEEVPQVGCCFNSVVTHQALAKVSPDKATSVRIGGTDLPCLRGKLTSTEGTPLHAVWVRLIPLSDTAGLNAAVYADVSDPNGHYAIYDIPPGDYDITLFRRLALNSGFRVLEKELTITIEQPPQSHRHVHQQDIELDLTPFRPLAYGQEAPTFDEILLDGTEFDLAEHRGKPVVLHFYATNCPACVQTFDFFDTLQERLGDQIVVVGISVDKDKAACQKFIQDKKPRHPQIYDGSATVNSIAKLYHLATIPTTFIIDAQGKISQIDLFGATLEKYIREKCLFQDKN